MSSIGGSGPTELVLNINFSSVPPGGETTISSGVAWIFRADRYLTVENPDSMRFVSLIETTFSG